MFKDVEKDYKSVLEITDKKASGHLDSSLHLTMWFINPLYYYVENGNAMRSYVTKMVVFDCTKIVFKSLEFESG